MHFSITTYRIAILIGCLMMAGGSLLTVEHLQAGKAEVRELDACELYIQNYSQAAIHQQRKHRIPASITLAQGILESSAGKSYLAVEGKNHFGIKCGNWTGEFVYKQDDGRLERFRKYATVEESFEDHSRFIAERSPYKSLFDLKPTDYVGWAHGLKRCGYATDPKYAHKLIELIERYGLHNYDLARETDEPPVVRRKTRTAPPAAPKKQVAEPKPERKRTLDTSRDMASVQREPGRKPTAHGVKVPKKAKPEQAPPKTEPAPKPAPAPSQKPAPAPKPAPTPAPQKEAAPAAKPAPAKQPAAQKQVAAKKPAPAAKKQAWAAKKPTPAAAPKKQDKKLLASTKKSGAAAAPKVAPNATKPAAANPAVKKNAWKKPVTPKKSAAAPQRPAVTPKKPAATPKKPTAAAKKPAAAPKKPAATPKKSAWVAKKPAPTPKATAPKRAPRPAQRSALSRKQNNNERPTVHTARRQRLERRRS